MIDSEILEDFRLFDIADRFYSPHKTKEKRYWLIEPIVSSDIVLPVSNDPLNKLSITRKFENVRSFSKTVIHIIMHTSQIPTFVCISWLSGMIPVSLGFI
jgi:hypothetical protein